MGALWFLSSKRPLPPQPPEEARAEPGLAERRTVTMAVGLRPGTSCLLRGPSSGWREQAEQNKEGFQ